MPMRMPLCADDAEQLLREWKPRIDTAVARRVRCHADRADAAQLASLALIKAAESYDSSFGKPFDNYAATAIANAAKDFARERQRHNARFRCDLDLPNTASRTVPADERIMVTEFVSQLPDQMRRVYGAIYELGCTQSEAAKMLGVTQPRVSHVLRRLLDQAKVALLQ